MGLSRLTLLLSMGASLMGAGTAALLEAPRPKAEASATVTVTAEAEAIDIEKTPNPVTVVDKRALEAAGDANLSDLLQDLLPGQVLATGGPGAQASICLNGARAQDTVVTLDGLRLTDAAGLGGVNPALIGLAGVDRVEIQRGPCSTRFGSDALGGAVALYSAGGAKDGFSGEARGTLGAPGSLGAGIREGSVAPAYGWGSGWVRAALAGSREEPPTESNHPARSHSAFLGLGQDLGADTLLTVNYLNTYSAASLPISWADWGTGRRPESQYNPERRSQNRTEVLGATLRTELSPSLHMEWVLGQVLQERHEPSYATGLPTDRYTSRRDQVSGSLSWRPAPRFSLNGGLEGSEESSFTPDRTRATARHLALLAESQIEFLEGLRAVVSVRSQKDRQQVPMAGDTQTENAISRTTWKLGLNWIPGGGWRVYATTGTGFSNPLLFQSSYNATNGGDLLRNEKSHSAQLGADWKRGAWRASLELSRTQYDNLVFYDPNGGTYNPDWGSYSGIYRNGADIRIQSGELRGGYAPEGWSLQAFYRNQEARDEQAPEASRFRTNSVLRRPFQSLGLDGHVVLGAFRLDGRWSWVGPRYEYGVPKALKTHFNDLSLGATWNQSQAFALTLRGKHLLQPRTSREQWLARTHDLENDASQVFGYPSQGPTLTLEARYRF